MSETEKKVEDSQPKGAVDVKQKLNEYLEDFNGAFDYVKNNHHQKWEQHLKAYKGIRTNIGYNGYSDAFVPETHTIIESLQANIAGGTQKFEYYPEDEEQEQDTKILTHRANYVMNCNKGKILLQNVIKDVLRFGNGFIHGGWNAQKKIPKLEIIPIWNFFADPTAVDLETARFVGHRYLTYKEDMEKETVINVETGQLEPKYKNLDMIRPVSGQGEETDKEIREKIFFGSTLGVNEKQVEVIRIYYANGKMVEIANRAAVILDIDTPLQLPERQVTQEIQMGDGMGGVVPQQIQKTLPAISPFLPYAQFRDYVEPSLFYGSGEIEIILPRQETLNDVENQDLDNMSYVNNTMFTVDPQFADMIPEIENQPGAIYALPKGALSVIEKGQMSQDVDYKKREIKDEMRRATAADEVIQGAQVENGSATATEITSVVSSANTRFSSKIATFEGEGFNQLATLIRKLDQVFLSAETKVRVMEENTPTYKEYDPAQFSGDYEPHVLLETSIQKLEMDKSNKTRALAELLLGNPVVNQQEAVRLILKDQKMKPDEIEKLLTLAQPPMMPPGMPGMPPGMTPPPMGNGMPPQMANLPQQALAGMGNAG